MTEIYCPACDEPINADNDHFVCEECGEECCDYCQLEGACMDCYDSIHQDDPQDIIDRPVNGPKD